MNVVKIKLYYRIINITHNIQRCSDLNVTRTFKFQVIKYTYISMFTSLSKILKHASTHNTQ